MGHPYFGLQAGAEIKKAARAKTNNRLKLRFFIGRFQIIFGEGDTPWG
jgi:hypothetical protein